MLVILLIVLLVLAFGAAPGWGPIAHTYGPYPSGILGTVIIVLLVLLLLGKL